MSLAKHYAELNCNDVSYLSLNFESKRNRKHHSVDEYVPKKEQQETIQNTTLFLQEQESVQNTNVYVSPRSQNRGVFRLNENRNKNDYNTQWRN